MKKNISLITLSLLLLAGCGSTTSNNSSQSSGDEQLSSSRISKIKFNLPEQIKWDNTNPKDANFRVFTPKGVEANKSPIKFVYQYVKHDKSSEILAQQVIAPLQKNCEKPVSNVFKTVSKYPNQVSYQTLCNQFKGASFGIVNYLDIFTDSQGSHVFIGEVKTPASVEPGKLDAPKTEEDKKVVQNTIALIKLAQKTMVEVVACDENEKCL